MYKKKDFVMIWTLKRLVKWELALQLANKVTWVLTQKWTLTHGHHGTPTAYHR